jgi:hypothetical protein
MQSSSPSSDLLFHLLSSPNQCHGVAAEVGAVAGVEAVPRFVLRSAKDLPQKDNQRRVLTGLTAMTATASMTEAGTDRRSARRLLFSFSIPGLAHKFHSSTSQKIRTKKLGRREEGVTVIAPAAGYGFVSLVVLL